MHWDACDEWLWQTQLTITELQERLANCSTGRPRQTTTATSTATEAPDFVGQTSETGFRLTPIVWGQSSFLPRIFGRWQASDSGTLVKVSVVPNFVAHFCLVIVFAFLGTLVYERQLLRVAALTLGSTLLGWLSLQVFHWAAASRARQKLRKLMEAVPLPIDAETSVPKPRSSFASWIAFIVVVLAGATIWRQIYVGAFSITSRPSVDLVYVFWTVQALALGWLWRYSRIQPRPQSHILWAFFLLEMTWALSVVSDGYTGDGRPILAWRWSPSRATGFAALQSSPEHLTRKVELPNPGPRDYAEFRGPRRDGVVRGLRLDPDWTKSPPRIVWQRPVGTGWSAFAVVGDFAITQEQRDEDEAVVCYELETGRPRWEHRDRAHFQEMMGGDGPRATPTIHDGRVYAVGATGILNCLDGSDGHVLWSVNIVTENSAPKSLFGIAGSPLIWRDLVIVAPGGPQASLVAYDRRTGRRVWHQGDAEAAYASPQLATFSGVEQILNFNAEGLYSHHPYDGRLRWSIAWLTPPERNNVCQPVVSTDAQKRDTLFISSGYGKGCALFDITPTGQHFIPRERWRSKLLQAKFTSVVERNGYVYGLDNNTLCCLELANGQRHWKGGRYGFGQVLLVEDHLLVLTEDGEIVLCEATPTAHRELARFPVLNGRTWNHPALIGDRLLIRNDRQAACVQLPKLANQ